jgi:hypothetical protein
VTSWVLDPHHLDGVRGQAFEDFDPAAIDAVKAVLTCGNTRDRVPPTTESGGRAAQTADPQADNLLGGVSDG